MVAGPLVDTPRMGLFRPAATVTSPSGDHWELYVSKTALPAWKGTDADDVYLGGQLNADIGLIELPLMILSFVWANVLVPLARVAVLLPVAVARGRRSRAVRIEAVTTFPYRQVLLWTTTDAYRQQVLDEIVAGLARGTVVQPAGAVYSGAR
jgi:hypothetical protein